MNKALEDNLYVNWGSSVQTFRQVRRDEYYFMRILRSEGELRVSKSLGNT
jgi:hypothetical protein